MILQIEIGGRVRQVSVERMGSADRFRFTLDGRTLELSAAKIDSETWSLVLADGSQHLVAVSGSPAAGLTVHLPSGVLPATLPGLQSRKRSAAGVRGAAAGSGPIHIVAPMPGKIVRVLAAAGQQVEAGQGIVVVEAMKMENELRVPRAGIVKEVPVREGMSVDAGALLAVVE